MRLVWFNMSQDGCLKITAIIHYARNTERGYKPCTFIAFIDFNFEFSPKKGTFTG